MSTGTLMSAYMFQTFLINFVFYSFVIFRSWPRYKYFNTAAGVYDRERNCGPFESNGVLTPLEEIKIFPTQEEPLTRLLLAILVQLTVYILLGMVSNHKASLVNMLQIVKKDKFKELE